MTTPEEALEQAAAAAETSGVLSLRNLRWRDIPRPDIDLARLVRVDLVGNRLSAVPDWVWEATHLQRLDLAANRLTVIGEGVGELRDLEVLDVSENRLTGLPAELAACLRLLELDATGNTIVDVQVIDALIRLASLDLARNRLQTLDQLVGAAELRILDLSANQIEALPPALVEMHDLRRLDLSGNRLTSAAIEELQLPANLVELRLDGNQLDSYPRDLASQIRVSVLGNRFDVAQAEPEPSVGAEVARAIEQMTTGAPEADRHYFDAPTYHLPGMELSGPGDAYQAIDLYYKRFSDLGASVQFGTGTSVDLAEIGRRRALDYVAENATTGPTVIRLQSGGEASKDRGASFIAEASERVQHASLVADDGTSYAFEGEAGPRVLNVAVGEHDGSLLSAHAALRPETVYQLRVDIGPAAIESVVVDAPAFPAQQLTPDTTEGWWFEVVVASSWVDVAAESHRIFLPTEGSSWLCDCEQEHSCSPDQRRPYLFVPFTTRSDAVPVSLRCTVYQRNNAVQSVRVDATVTASDAAAGAIVGIVDYTLAKDAARAAAFAPRDLSILSNHTTGVHTIVIKGRGKPIPVDLTETEAQRVLTEIRKELSSITLGDDGQTNQYDATNAKTAAGLIRDLTALAHLGAALFSAVVPDLDDQLALADSLAHRATIQVARISRVTFPWALIYDLPHELNEPFSPCPLLADWDNRRAQLASYPETCPHAAQHAPINTLCPYGFWGFRHLIEQPASVRGDALVTEIPVAPGSTAALIHSLQLDASLTASHLAALESMLQVNFHPAVCTDKPAVLAAWNAEALPLIYFYCHGKTATLAHSQLPVPVLEIGQDVLLGSADFASWARAKMWTDPRRWVTVPPLVFINGCHTAALSPEDVVTFVDAFAGIHAAGVIGTEIAVAQPTASEFARNFYSYLTTASVAGRRPAGQALYMARIDLLAKGNVSGLVYTPFCSMDLVLQTEGST